MEGKERLDTATWQLLKEEILYAIALALNGS
jgi:hypothetical protein